MDNQNSEAIIGQDGWEDPKTPPDSDRTVQVAWDDLSYGDNSLAFYDSGKWWNLRPMFPMTDGHIGAWRERQS